ncbi:MAG: alpha/beta hydrolase family protein [Gammaproteobacteria bacterium]|nr:alpha/beta hydrolase family protein [Gammaproteobacteria bacterium]
MKYTVFILCFFISSLHLYAADLEREKRLADEIADFIIDGEAIYLDSGNHRFLNIYMQSESTQPKGGAIILHGRGFHPNWKDVALPLRTGLPEHGWHTLSVQMPVLHKQAKYYDYLPILPEAFPRIEAAINFLKKQGLKNIVLIAHSCSVHMSMAWLEQPGEKNINAYIGVAMGATDYKQPMKKDFPFMQLTIPVLDIYGSKDFPAVTNNAATRLEMIKMAGNSKSDQRMLIDADHYFTEKGDILLSEIAQWLDTL